MQTITRPPKARLRETFSGLTTLCGRIRRRAGRTELVMGDWITVTMTGETAGLGRDRDQVEVDGVATWDAATDLPLSIHVTAGRGARSVDVVDAFSSLASAAGPHWNGASPANHLKRIRCEA